MHVSLNWLRELVSFDLEPEALAEALTLAGFEVEDIEDRRTLADGVVVGKVLAATQHPNADRLQVCQVDVGDGTPRSIVCGAANARAGITVAVALPGVYLPAIDLKLRRSKLRGEVSEGMLCSLGELGLAKSEGIYEFAGEPRLGSDVRPLLGLDDVILDVTSTANRADALSMVGIAREVAALTDGVVTLPAVPSLPTQSTSLPPVRLKIEDPAACPAYSGTLIRGVKVGASPLWLQRRVEAAGMRSINVIVDITNYILLEWGQPLHAFDWQKLQQVMGESADPTLGVRLAQPGETLVTLDGQTRSLHAHNLLITAADQPVALAGVMGGEATEVDPDSVDILLEAALFDPVAVRRSARAQTLRSEASARYERGVDFSAWLTARDRAIGLILELAGGELVGSGVEDRRPQGDRHVTLRLQRVIDLLGDELDAEAVEQMLSALGFELTPQPLPSEPTDENPDNLAIWEVQVPPYRLRDVEREVDLIEEFARLYGYDRFSETLPAETEVGALSEDEAAVRRIREALRAVGLTELMHISLCPRSTGVPVVITNPLAEEFSALRQELLPNLIDSFAFNLDQGNGPLQGFEVGRVFWRDEDYQEADHVAGIFGGNPTQADWQKQSQAYDWYAAKGLIQSVLQRLGLTAEFQPDQRHPSLHPGRTASLWLEGERLGTFGQLHPKLRQEKGFPEAVYAFEWDLDVLLSVLIANPLPIYQPFSTFPPSDRDIAFFSANDVTVANLTRAIADVAGPLLQSVELFDQYQGSGVPEGQRSLAFRLVYRAPDRTLTEAEVEAAHQRVRDHLEEKFKVSLRS